MAIDTKKELSRGTGQFLLVATHAEADPPDSALIARARLGDRDAFAAVYRRYSPTVYRFARSLCGSAAAAEDVLQDVFTALIRDLDRYDESRAPLAPYLYGIARNLSRQRVRRDRRHLVLDDVEEPAGATADPGADMTLAERRVAVRRALAVLPMRYREVIVLCDLHELDYVSAARVLDVPVGTVRSRLHRGRQMLAERLARATDDRRRKAVRAPWRKVW